MGRVTIRSGWTVQIRVNTASTDPASAHTSPVHYIVALATLLRLRRASPFLLHSQPRRPLLPRPRTTPVSISAHHVLRMEWGSSWQPTRKITLSLHEYDTLSRQGQITTSSRVSNKRLEAKESDSQTKQKRKCLRYTSVERTKPYPVPVWELSGVDMAMLEQQYVVAKRLSEDEVAGKIMELMLSCTDTLLKGNGYSFEIPRSDAKQREYINDLSFPLLKRGVYSTRSFTDGKCTKTACMTAWLLSKLYQLVRTGMTITLRDLFYQAALLFGNQKTVNGILVDITLLLPCSRFSLNVTSDKTGKVCGMIAIEFNDDIPLSCSRGALIPDDSSIISGFSTIKDSQVDFILVVEKGTVYDYLRKNNFHVKNRCIIITSNGMPTMATRSFLKCLYMHTNLTIYGMCDPDPHGVNILHVYDQGSVELAHENINLAVPHLIWIGVTLKDVLDAGLELNQRNSEKLKPSEYAILQRLLNDAHIIPRFWKGHMEYMMSVGKKTHLEIFHEKGFHYIAQVLLPSMIARARKDMYRLSVPSVVQAHVDEVSWANPQTQRRDILKS
ncbi:unnamed protein product [Urochloa humidicola]